MIPAAGAPGTAGSGFRVAREAADDVAGRLVDVLTLRLSPSVARYLAKDLLPVVEQIAEERARQALESAAQAAEGMHDPPAPDCVEWAGWLRARAARSAR